MSKLATLELSEALPIDLDRIKEFYSTMGAQRAEDMLHHGFEALARDLTEVEKMFSQSQFAALRRPLWSAQKTSQEIGLSELSKQVGHVLDALEGGDVIAISATLLRCLRNAAPVLSSPDAGKSSIR